MLFLICIIGYVSKRNPSTGSRFIRTLVSTFYKQAGIKHANELGEKVSIYHDMGRLPSKHIGSTNVLIRHERIIQILHLVGS